MSESLIYILKKMCSYVDADYDSIDFQENDWYFKYEWTQEEEKNFIEWLANEIKTNNKLRKEVSTLSYRPTKARAKAFASHFNMMFGWKTKLKEK